jgi:hypothetical protein
MKWPKILHLPDSPGITDEDEMLKNIKARSVRIGLSVNYFPHE